MKESVWLGGLGLLALVWSSGPARAQICAGDCNGSLTVTINELITCVNIALDTLPVSSCMQCDVSGNGKVEINELISAVNIAGTGCNPGPTPTPGGGAVICGNGTKETGEECDDGNNFGGDGCAANCTNEVRRQTDLDPAKSIGTIQLSSIPIPLSLRGHQVLTSGKARTTAVMGPGGTQLFAPGEIPITVKAADVQFDPINIMGLFCACVRGVEVPEFGPGNSGVGVLGCGSGGLSNVDFLVEQDHDTTVGSPFNSGSSKGLPDDPQCNAEFNGGEQLISDACLEGVGAACSGDTNEHVAVTTGAHQRPAACNSPRVYTFTGGQGPRGSVMLRTNTANGVLNNANSPDACVPIRNQNGTCSTASLAAFGGDCTPCTEDDPQKGMPMVGVTTSGTATVIVYDTNDTAGVTLGEGAKCGGTNCIGQVTGVPADNCDDLIQHPDAEIPLHGALVTASPSLDQTGGDIVLTTTLAAKQQQ